MNLFAEGSVTVEAILFDGTAATGERIGTWIAGKGKPAKVFISDCDPSLSWVEFPFKQAKPGSPLFHMRLTAGQWVVLGPDGLERWTQAQFEKVFHRVTVEQ